jgi:uncharacterized protein YukE
VSVPDGAARGATRAGLPWPEGYPGALADASRSAASGADVLRNSAARLQSAARGAAGWEGQGAVAFRTAAGEEHAAMSRGADGLEQAASALKTLSTTLSEAQQQVQRLADEVVTAEEEAERASARAAGAQLVAAATGVAVSLAGDDPSPSLVSAADDAADDAAAASTLAGNAAAHAQQVRERNTRLAQDACDEVLRVDRTTAAAVDHAAAVAPLSGIPAGSPTPANKFAQTVLSGLTIDQWRAIAYWRAGIDASSWNPDAGLFANDKTVQLVYAYYGNLFLQHPELQWAGMANLVGPMFYAGWQDMYAVRGLSDDGDRARYLSELLGLPSLPGAAYDAADTLSILPGGFLNPANLAEHLTSEELEWYEDKFLVMQKSIFDDLAWQHEAYLMGGLPLMQQLRSQNMINTNTLNAWQDIASGDPDSVARGNTGLLRREQFDVIQPYYTEMRDHHGPVGDVATYAFSTMAEDPMPGGQAYRDYNPIELSVDLVPDIPVGPLGPFGPHFDIPTPDVDVHQTLPLPDGNLSNFDDRWDWIEHDMLPRYHDFLQNPDAVRATIATPVADRAEDFRKLPDLPYPGGS